MNSKVITIKVFHYFNPALRVFVYFLSFICSYYYRVRSSKFNDIFVQVSGLPIGRVPGCSLCSSCFW